MSGAPWTVEAIYRHPVKSLGSEALESVSVQPGGTLPHDRTWAIAHGGAWDASNPAWMGGSAKMVSTSSAPRLAQVITRLEETTGSVHLAHPDLGELSVQPSDPLHHPVLTNWIKPLLEGTGRKGPFQVCEAPGVAFTDFEDTHVSIATCNSLRALEQHVGQSLEDSRFRMNLWLEGPAPWSELDWVDRDVEIGEVRLKVIARDARCNATNANPATGKRDTQIPGLLRKIFGHMDFGVYAQVTRGGSIARGDTAQLI
ncbi:MAG: MOSC N-terminal beta barrel domain-containing protein [Pseudomonadota bacterium]